MERAVVLVSGGINSSVAAAVAKEQYEVALLHVAWGHRAADRELTAFESVAAALKIERTVVAEMSCLGMFGGNARAGRKQAIEDANALGAETPATFVLGLIPTMLALACTWAGAIGARKVIIGLSEDHDVPGPRISDLYPDYRQEFLQTFNLMLDYARPPKRELAVEAPLIDLTRSEVIRLGKRMQVPLEKTWSCYHEGEKPCGRCWACTTRASGFLRAGLADPLTLQAAHTS